MKAIATLYTEGVAAHGLPRHRLPVFNDERGRAQQRFDILEKNILAMYLPYPAAWLLVL